MTVLLSDLGRVVIEVDLHRVVEGLSELSPLEDDAILGVLEDDTAKAFERGELDGPDYLEHLRGALRTDVGDDRLRDAYNRIFVGVDLAVVDLYERLRSRLEGLIGLTNSNPIHHVEADLRFADAYRRFDAIHGSYQLGARKPEPAAYHEVLRREGLSPSQVVFVDDLDVNVAAARQLGIDAIVFRSADQLATELETRLG